MLKKGKYKEGATGTRLPCPSAPKRSEVQAHYRGRSPDSQVIARSATFPFLPEQWYARRSARCSQWRDRAGVSPASLFTRHHRRAPRNSFHAYTVAWRGQLITEKRNAFDSDTPVNSALRRALFRILNLRSVDQNAIALSDTVFSFVVRGRGVKQ